MVRNLPRGPDRPQAWADRLHRQSTHVPLRRLYAGPMWQSALSLEARAADLGYDVDLWVVSAGVGLSRADATSPAYSASFSAGPDQVAAEPAGRLAWWAELGRVSLFGRAPTELSNVRKEADEVLIALSPAYLEALAGELQHFAGDEGVATMSSHTPSRRSPVSSQGLRQSLGGTQITLNARAAAKYLEVAGGVPLGSEEAHTRWSTWAGGNRRREAEARPRLDDAEVRHFIATGLSAGTTSRTRLLTELRRSGLACEQSRFARLYTEVQESL
jgi:hypothetical protein